MAPAVARETTTKLSVWGTSRGVRLPRPLCDSVGISIGSDLSLHAGEDEQGSFIIIRPAAAHRSYADAPFRSMDELFAGYSGDYAPREPDWGADVGAEVVE